MKMIGIAQIFMVLFALVSCGQNSGNSAVSDPVLARVGESPIRQSQFDVMLEKMSPRVREHADTQLETVILQGLVRTRALAAMAEPQLDANEKMLLDARVKSYRDELLVQSYIRKNIKPEPVTTEMVEQYYSDHKAEYTTGGKVTYEYMVTTEPKLDDTSMSAVLAAFSKLKNTSDWKRYANELKKKGIPADYKLASILPVSIDKDLRAQVGKLAVGEVTDVIYGEHIYVARLIKREPDVVKPLFEISADIRKKLAPQRLKQALAQHVDQALKNATVQYME